MATWRDNSVNVAVRYGASPTFTTVDYATEPEKMSPRSAEPAWIG